MYNDECMNYASYYDLPNPPMDNFDAIGHFTQIVWKDTTTVGCWTQLCSTLGNSGSSDPLSFTVCNFGPPGNTTRRTLGIPSVSNLDIRERRKWIWRQCRTSPQPTGLRGSVTRLFAIEIPGWRLAWGTLFSCMYFICLVTVLVHEGGWVVPSIALPSLPYK
jgi:Cysteine-rich secretory protein family